jgi:hypothetical protein
VRVDLGESQLQIEHFISYFTKKLEIDAALGHFLVWLVPAVFNFCPLEMLSEKEECGAPFSDGQKNLKFKCQNEQNNEHAFVTVPLSKQCNPT